MKIKSKTLIIGIVLGFIYSLYISYYFGTAAYTHLSGLEYLAMQLALDMVYPHMLACYSGCAFSIVTLAMKTKWSTIVAFTSYYLASLLFPMYAIFSLPIAIIITIGYVLNNKQ